MHSRPASQSILAAGALCGLLLLAGCAGFISIPPPGMSQMADDAQRAACASVYGSNLLPITSYPQIAASGGFSTSGHVSFGSGGFSSGRIPYGVTPSVPYAPYATTPSRSVLTPEENCLLAHGYTIKRADGAILRPPVSQAYVGVTNPSIALPNNQNAPNAQNFPSTPRPTPSNSISTVDSRFINIVFDNREILFKAAHPTGILDDIRGESQADSSGKSVVVEHLIWHGLGGKGYETVITFTIQYINSNIDDISMEYFDRNNPLFEAFKGSEAGKQLLADVIIAKLKRDKKYISSKLIEILNNSTTIKGALVNYLRYLMNN